MESIASLFIEPIWVVYIIFSLLTDKVYIGHTNNMKRRWKKHKASPHNNCTSRILMAYPDADYRIVASGFECEWDTRVEEQRQLDLHELTKVNKNRAIGLSGEELIKADKNRKREYKARPEIKARLKAYYERPEIIARRKECSRRPDQKAKKSEGGKNRYIKQQVRLVMDDLLDAVELNVSMQDC